LDGAAGSIPAVLKFVFKSDAWDESLIAGLEFVAISRGELFVDAFVLLSRSPVLLPLSQRELWLPIPFHINYEHKRQKAPNCNGAPQSIPMGISHKRALEEGRTGRDSWFESFGFQINPFFGPSLSEC
jgi:hypothetical protein